MRISNREDSCWLKLDFCHKERNSNSISHRSSLFEQDSMWTYQVSQYLQSYLLAFRICHKTSHPKIGSSGRRSTLSVERQKRRVAQLKSFHVVEWTARRGKKDADSGRGAKAGDGFIWRQQTCYALHLGGDVDGFFGSLLLFAVAGNRPELRVVSLLKNNHGFQEATQKRESNLPNWLSLSCQPNLDDSASAKHQTSSQGYIWFRHPN